MSNKVVVFADHIQNQTILEIIKHHRKSWMDNLYQVVLSSLKGCKNIKDFKHNLAKHNIKVIAPKYKGHVYKDKFLYVCHPSKPKQKKYFVSQKRLGVTKDIVIKAIKYGFRIKKVPINVPD